ncbi:MAG: hypothetical protein P1U77_08540 [Rubripirellula sp.]|nr:hypothetical protein [Rubripirellula sp.]
MPLTRTDNRRRAQLHRERSRQNAATVIRIVATGKAIQNLGEKTRDSSESQSPQQQGLI